MGDLIVMTRPAQGVRREKSTQGDADILFFTGVRYARMPEPVAALAAVTPPRKPGKPRRGPGKNNDMKRA